MDEAGLAQLYERYAPAIYAHCRRLLHSPSAARDATQEAFVRVLARGPALLAGEDALRYLYRVSTNVCLNQIREQKVHDRATPALAVRAGSGGSAESGHADRQFVHALLERSDETGAAIAVMHYVDGMSQVEIAEVLGITRRTVFNRLRKLEKIAEELMKVATPEGGGAGEETPVEVTKEGRRGGG
jgi:RNA polymerase sigma-70 factor (ECF subfamily)